MGEVDDLEVRESTPADVHLAAAASALIDAVADEYDIARRTPEWLAAKIEKRRAAVALDGETLVGFGYWSAWEGDAFVSHSGLVVSPEVKGRGVGRLLKAVLFDSTRRQLPQAKILSLTTSPQVRKMNLSLGFRVVPLDQLTKDEAFWAGCQSCRNYADVQARGERCCCEGMLWVPLAPADA